MAMVSGRARLMAANMSRQVLWAGVLPAWVGRPEGTLEPSLEFSRFATTEGAATARRLAYRLNERQEIEVWVWPGLDPAPGVVPARYPLLAGVASLGTGEYLGKFRDQRTSGGAARDYDR